MGVNYGVNKVRFPAPVPVGCGCAPTRARRGRPRPDGGAQLVAGSTIEREGGDKPVCVAETVVRFYN